MSIAAIKILQKELRLDDGTYRAILFRVAGVTSATQLSAEGDRAVMRELYSIRDDRAADLQSRPKTPTESKIWAIWYDIKGYLPDQERTAAYLLGIIRRASGNPVVTTTDDIALLTPRQAYRTIEALKLRRAQEEQKFQQEGVPF